MPRTPSYPRALSTNTAQAPSEGRYAAGRSSSTAAGSSSPMVPETAAAALPGVDGMAEKIVKYVPAEVLAFYAPAYAMIPEGEIMLQRIVLGAGLFGTVIYLLAARPKSSGPPAYFYVLAAIAFLVWAIGVSSIGVDLLGLSAETSTVLFAVGVFLIPGIDQLLTRFLPPSTP